MAPSARGLRPQAVGERTVRLPEIFRAMARFSPSAPSGHLPRRGRFFDTLGFPQGGKLSPKVTDEGQTFRGSPLAGNSGTAAPHPSVVGATDTFPQGGRLRLSKKVCSPLGPLCEGAPPAGGGGENCTAARNISDYGKVLSLRPFGAPPSQREVFRHAELPPRGEAIYRFPLR